jgi:hypothetical protein
VSLLGDNLEPLGRRFPGLARELASLAPAALEILPSSSGEPSARFGGKLLHSAHDPLAEASRLAEAGLPPWADGAIILGSGLGYLAEAALRSSGLRAVILCEAEPGLLRAALEARDLRSMLGDERLGFVLGGAPDRILGALEASGLKRPVILGNRSLESLFPDWYGGLRAAAGRFIRKEETNENTLRKFGGLWARNLARNLPALAETPGVACLEGRFSGIPALVLAAGPSLDRILPRLGELRERLLLVAVDTSLRSVLGAGYQPDFLLVVDPQYWNWRHIADLEAPGSYLVSEPAVFPPVFRFPCRGRFIASSIFPLGRALESGEPSRGLLGAGGSVATSAWDFARLLGAPAIHLAGLDLGFPGRRTHARASLFEQRALATGLRRSPPATAESAALFGPGCRPVPADGGGSLLSDERMALYAWWFESRLAAPDAPPTTRLSPGGRFIPGLGSCDPEELMDLPPRREEIDARLAGLAGLSAPPGTRARLASRVADLRAELASIERTALSAREAAAAAIAALAAGKDPRRHCETLDRADRRILGNAAKEVVGFLLPPAREILSARATSLAESLGHSESLYRRVAEAAGANLRYLEEGSRAADLDKNA